MLRTLVWMLAFGLALPAPAVARSPVVGEDELPEPEDGGYPERPKPEPKPEAEPEAEADEKSESGDRSDDDFGGEWMSDIGLALFVHVAPGENMNGRQRTVLTKGLVDELSKLQETRVSAQAPVVASSEGESCPEQETSCLTRLAKSLGAEEVVMVRTADLDGSKVLTVKRVRIRDGSVMGAVTRQMTGGQGEEYLLILGDAVEELFPGRPLKTGEIRGADPALVERYNPPPFQPWQFLAAVGLTGGGVLATVSLGLSARAAEEDYNDYAQLGQTEVIEGNTLKKKGDTAESRAALTNVVGAVTLGLAAGTALMFFFTDWAGDDILQASVAPTDGGLTVGLGGGF